MLKKVEDFIDKQEKLVLTIIFFIFTMIYIWMAWDFVNEYTSFAENHYEAKSFMPIVSFISMYLLFVIFVMTIIEFKNKEETSEEKKRKKEKTKNIIRAGLLFISGLIGVYGLVKANINVVHNNFEIEMLRNENENLKKLDNNISERIRTLEKWQQTIIKNKKS